MIDNWLCPVAQVYDADFEEWLQLELTELPADVGTLVRIKLLSTPTVTPVAPAGRLPPSPAAVPPPAPRSPQPPQPPQPPLAQAPGSASGGGGSSGGRAGGLGAVGSEVPDATELADKGKELADKGMAKLQAVDEKTKAAALALKAKLAADLGLSGGAPSPPTPQANIPSASVFCMSAACCVRGGDLGAGDIMQSGLVGDALKLKDGARARCPPAPHPSHRFL